MICDLKHLSIQKIELCQHINELEKLKKKKKCIQKVNALELIARKSIIKHLYYMLKCFKASHDAPHESPE